jgi:hypothetical protein
VDAMDEARKMRDFDTSDDVRAVLMQDWGVAVDTESKQWWVGDRNDLRLAKFGIALPLVFVAVRDVAE